MDISTHMTTLRKEYTGIPGYIQIYTNHNKNCCDVKYFSDISQPENYVLFSMHEFLLKESKAMIYSLHHKMILMFMMKNFITIYTYYYHGSKMTYDELSELFKKIKVLTSSDVNTCTYHQLEY